MKSVDEQSSVPMDSAEKDHATLSPKFQKQNPAFRSPRQFNGDLNATWRDGSLKGETRRFKMSPHNYVFAHHLWT